VLDHQRRIAAMTALSGPIGVGSGCARQHRAPITLRHEVERVDILVGQLLGCVRATR
jgi:hypothetical protein